MIDFTGCKITKKAYGGANGTKKCIIYDGENYMLKLPTHPKRKTALSYTNSCVSEYLSCHIYEMLQIPVQKTILGTFQTSTGVHLAVACKDFTKPGIILMDFAALKNQVVDSLFGGYNTDLNEILFAIEKQDSIDPQPVIGRFWEMFVADALLGNFDRHNGNWGFLYNEANDTVALAPVYDCGSSLYPQADAETMNKILTSTGERHTRIYNYPASAISLDGKKLSYYDFLTTVDNEDCLEALIKIYPYIDLDLIDQLIDTTEGLDSLQREFYKTMLKERYDLILTPAYDRAHAIMKDHSRIQEMDAFER